MATKALCILASLALCAVVATQGAENPIVLTSNGAVRGTREMIESLEAEVDSFLGIPFAKPPVGDLRFSPPAPLTEKWSETRDGTFYRPSCIQNMTDQNIPGESSEDCLYLNVFRPSNLTSSAAVFLWIYGGSYRSGSATLYAAEALASIGQMVVVTINYRLGALGFLVTTSEQAKGNAGMLDQRMAMSWVQANIEAFGGSKDKVTIAGESAGAGSVSAHVLSPGSQSLFRRAISESGAATSRWAVKSRPFGMAAAKAFSAQLKCNEGDLSCLRSRSPSEILIAQEAVYKSFAASAQGLAFTPTSGGSFLPSEPLSMLQSGHFKKTEYMSGVNEDEYSLFLLPFVGQYVQVDSQGQASTNKTVFDGFLRQLILTGAMPGTPPANTAMLQAATYEYTNWTMPDSNISRLQQIIKMGTDVYFNCPLSLLAQNYANKEATKQGSKLFVYRFTHTSSIYPSWAGVPHSAEIIYVFGAPLLQPSIPIAPVGNAKSAGNYTFTEADRAVSLRMINMWSAFVKTGNPNGGLSDSSVTSWPTYSPQSPHYLEINNNLTLKEYLHPRECSFWTNFMPMLANSCEQPPTKSSPQSEPTPFNAGCTSSNAQTTDSRKGWKIATVTIAVVAFVLVVVLVVLLLQEKLRKGEYSYKREKLLA